MESHAEGVVRAASQGIGDLEMTAITTRSTAFAAHEHVDDLELLVAVVRLRHEQLLEVDAYSASSIRV